MAGAFVGQLSFSGPSSGVRASLRFIGFWVCGLYSHLMVARAYSWPGIFWPGPSVGLPLAGVSLQSPTLKVNLVT